MTDSTLDPRDDFFGWMRDQERRVRAIERARRRTPYNGESPPVTPPTATTPITGTDSGQLQVVWDGTFIDADEIPSGFAGMEVHASRFPGDAQTDDTLVGVVHDPNGGSVTAPLPEGDWYVTFRTRTSDAQGHASGEAVQHIDAPAEAPPSSDPKPPTGLTGSAELVWVGASNYSADVHLEWTAPTQRTDNSPLTVTGYRVYHRFTGGTWKVATLVAAGQTDVDLTGYWAAQDWDFAVTAIDEWGKESVFSNVLPMGMPTDTTPPGKPSVPAIGYDLGLVVLDWNGRLASGGAQPVDYDHTDLEVLISGVWQVLDVRRSAGTFIPVGLTTGETYSARLVSYDTSDNASVPSDTFLLEPVEDPKWEQVEQDLEDAQDRIDEAKQRLDDAFGVDMSFPVLVSSVVEYAVNSSETTPPSGGWSTDTPERNPGEFIWYRTVVTYADNSTSTSNPALLTGNTGPEGPGGTPAPVITLEATTQVLVVPAAGGATTPATAEVTGSAENTSITTWEYAVDGGSFSTTAPTGVSRTGSTVTVTGATFSGATLTVRASDGTVADTITVAKVADGQPGQDGEDGEPGVGIASTQIRYQTGNSGTVAPTGTWQTDPTPTSTGQFLWTRIVTTYTDATTDTAYSVAAHGTPGADGDDGNDGVGVQGTEVRYQTSDSGTVIPTGSWSVNPTATNPGEYLWTRTVITYTDSTTSTAYAVAAHGEDGVPGADAYTVLLTNESHTFAGDVDHALADSAVSAVIAYKGTTQQAATIGTITGQVTGLSTSIQNNGTTTAQVTITVTTALVALSGELVVPVTVDGVQFERTISWSVSRKGAQGAPGNDGRGITNTEVRYQTGSSGTSVPGGTWQVNPTPTTTGQFLWTRTVVTYTDSTTSTSYSVAAHGTPGADGDDGNDGVGVSSTEVRYQTGNSGTTAPSGTWQVNPTPTSTGQFLWTRTVTTYTDLSTSTAYAVAAHGEPGADGSDGRGIESTEIRYQVGSSGTTPPGGSWLVTVPATTTGQFLWTRTVTEFTDSTSTTAYSVAAHGTPGADGDDGNDGVGVQGTEVRYQTGNSGTTPPTGTWQANPTATNPGQFLWTRTVITYTDSSTSTAYAVAAHGEDGLDGAPGVGISSTQIRYQVGSSGTTAPTGTWLSTVPATSTGQFLWTRTVTNYTDSTSTTAYSVAAHGTPGADGDDGNDGVGVQSTQVRYQVGSSPTSAPSGTWQTNPPATSPGQYLWTRTVITYTDSTTTTMYAVAAHGQTGEQGVSITSITPYYQQKVPPAPAKPTVSPPPAPWTTTEPSWVAGQTLYRTERIVYSTGTVVYTDVTAVAAYQAADAAMTAANGKNKTTYSNVSTVPGPAPSSTTGRVNGDIHRNRAQTGGFTYEGNFIPAGTIVAEWQLVSGAWQPAPLSYTTLTAVDIGKLTAGSGDIDTLVAQEFTAAVATLGDTFVENLTVTGTSTMDTVTAVNFTSKFAEFVEVEAHNIKTGLLDAVITISGRIQTGTSGARVVIDDSGIIRYDSSNDVIFDATGDQIYMRGEIQALGSAGSGVTVKPANLGALDGKGMIEFTYPGMMEAPAIAMYSSDLVNFKMFRLTGGKWTPETDDDISTLDLYAPTITGLSSLAKLHGGRAVIQGLDTGGTATHITSPFGGSTRIESGGYPSPTGSNEAGGVVIAAGAVGSASPASQGGSVSIIAGANDGFSVHSSSSIKLTSRYVDVAYGGMRFGGPWFTGGGYQMRIESRYNAANLFMFRQPLDFFSGADTLLESGTLRFTIGTTVDVASGTTFRALGGFQLGSDRLDTAWTAFTPSFTENGISPSWGNSTRLGAYQRIGKTVHFRAEILFGSTFAYGSANSYWSLALPVTARSGVQQLVSVHAVSSAAFGGEASGLGKIEGTSSGVTRMYVKGYGQSSTYTIRGDAGWVAGNRLIVTGTYEAA